MLNLFTIIDYQAVISNTKYIARIMPIATANTLKIFDNTFFMEIILLNFFDKSLYRDFIVAFAVYFVFASLTKTKLLILKRLVASSCYILIIKQCNYCVFATLTKKAKF